MKKNVAVYTRKSFTGALAGICMIFGASVAVAAPPTTVPETYATVTIGDFPGMLDRVGELSNKVKPGLSGELIRGQLGMMLGDEGLKSLAPGSGVVITVPTSGRPFLLMETAEGKAQAVADLLKQKGLMTETVTDKLVAVASDEASLNNAKGTMGTAAAGNLDGNDDKFIVATIDADKLVQDKGPWLQDTLKKLGDRVADSDSGSTGSGQMLSFAGGLFTAVGKRTDVAQIKIDISGEGVQFEKTLYPLGGVKLEDPSGPTGQELVKALPVSGDPSIRYESFIDTQSAIRGMMPIVGEAMDSAGLDASVKQELGRLANLAGEAFGDGFAGWVAFGDDKPVGAYLVSVQDQAKAVQYLDEATRSFAEGAAGQFYETLGIDTSATLTKDAAQVDGQPAHRLSVKLSGDAMETNPFFKMYNMENAMITFVDENRMLIALDGSKLEEMVKAVKAGSADSSELKARGELPQGGDLYIDYNLAFMAKAAGKDNPELGTSLEGLKDAPILEGAYVEDDSFRFVMLLPDDLITRAASTFQAFAQKAQQMRQGDEDTTETMIHMDPQTTTGTE